MESGKKLARKTPNNTKLDEDTIERLCGYVIMGLTIRQACSLFGISERTYRHWRKWGREGKAEIYERFYGATRRAEAFTTIELTALWQHAAQRDWRAARAFLESRWPEDWGRGRRRSEDRKPSQNVTLNVILAPGQSLTEALPPHFLEGQIRLGTIAPAQSSAKLGLNAPAEGQEQS